MTRTLTAIVAVIAVAAVPATSVGSTHPSHGKGHGRGHAPSKQRTYELSGVIESVTARQGTIVVAVAQRRGSTNRAARSFRGHRVTVDVSAARLKFTGVNRPGLSDLRSGQRVRVVARARPGLTPGSARPLHAKRVTARPADGRREGGHSRGQGSGGTGEEDAAAGGDDADETGDGADTDDDGAGGTAGVDLADDTADDVD